MLLKTSRREPAAIGRYDLHEKLGTGGMGTVYRGCDRETGETVAIKVLAAKLADNPKLHYRMVQEFRSASKLDHPNIVRAIDLAVDGSSVYLVMEYVEGDSLGGLIARNGRLPEGQAVRIITQAAQGLHYAHGRRVIHRDVKPDNILVRADGRAKLADFGLAKDKENDKDLTRPATGLGTPHFMAPEQYTDAKNAGVLCDVYSLGATLYMTVTGKLPFESCVSLVNLAKKLKGEVPPPREIVPDLSERVDEAICRAMNPDPAKRPQNCLQFAQLLPSSGQWGRLGEYSARSRAPGQTGNERRTAPRHPCTLGVSCVIDTDLFGSGADSVEVWPGTVHDLSPRGVGLVISRRFEPGTMLRVDLESSGGTARELPARVVNVRSEAAGHWFHGCVFPEPLTDADLRDLLRTTR
jgi:serine/threonine protein kinase